MNHEFDHDYVNYQFFYYNKYSNINKNLIRLKNNIVINQLLFDQML
jgi:hypothetical protein